MLHVIGQPARIGVEVRESNRVTLTAGQRTRIANSCAPRGAGSPEWRVLGRGRVKRVRSRGKDREKDEESVRSDRRKETLTCRRIERERRRGTARVKGRTGTRGIQQLPLNVFNAAVEARKRSHRSVPRPEKCGGDGTVWAGRSGAALASCSSWTLSLSLYVPGGIAIAGSFKHAGIQSLTASRAPAVQEAGGDGGDDT